MHWNHRVLRTTDKVFGMSYAIHECYYDKLYHTKPYTWGEEPEPVVAETLEGLRTTLKWMLTALEKPVLADVGDKLLEVEDSLPAEVSYDDKCTSDEIVTLPIAGRTITNATAWADGSGISIRLDNDAIVQIHATDDTVKWEIEEKPE